MATATSIGLAWCGLAAALDAATPGASPEDGAFFESTVRPLLAAQCYACHGAENPGGGVRLDQASDLQPDALRDVLQNRPDSLHPPVACSAAEREVFLEWIGRGAPWPVETRKRYERLPMEDLITVTRENHWSFRPVVEPAPPAIGDTSWPRSPIDAFVLARLEEAGLAPSPAASRRALIQRAYHDLTGLPPTAEEIEAFERDPDAEAFAGVVERLLASPHFGERWGRHWLDVARYSDTQGSSFREDRLFPFSHTYRDYVIRAFNEDLPYDEFILHQLAADKLELGEDKRPLAALGFITLGKSFDNNVHDRIDDRIDVVTRGFLALTVNCARCHDHKFDPIPTADYYALYGVFRSSREPDELPLIEAPDTTVPAYQAYLEGLAAVESARDGLARQIHGNLLAHARDHIGAYLQAAFDARAFTEQAQYQALATERSLRAPLIERWRNFLSTLSGTDHPVFSPWAEFAAVPAEDFAVKAEAVARRIANNQNLETRAHPDVQDLFRASAPASMAEVNERYAALFARIDVAWKNRLVAHSQRAARGEVGMELPPALPDAAREELRLVLYGAGYPTHLTEAEAIQCAEPAERDRLSQRRAAVEKHKNSHPGRPNRAMALEDAPELYDPVVFVRGDAGLPGAAVPRRFLSVLDASRTPFTQGSGRLELARAIARRDNPLTARVFANRVWMHLFDAPLAGTPSDFGLQGESPSHPELLDYLAWHFMEDGWSVKGLIRRIMLSSAYQQSSGGSAAGQSLDPENELLWRQNRRRLGFEVMRDHLLAASGNLDLRMGGAATNITRPPFANRRTVYAEVDREALPAMFRTFDFATPATHTPLRLETTVPQQALYLMNSPFIAEQARRAAARPDVVSTEDPGDRVRALYRAILRREPLQREVDLGTFFVAGQDVAEVHVPERDAPRWLYGHGRLDETTGKVASFTEFPYWTGETFQGGEKLPDEALGWAVISRLGGRPGDAQHAVIRRWISPADSLVSVVGELYHHSSAGDGIRGYIISSRAGILWQGDVQDGMLPTVVDDSAIRAGDTIDLVVTCKENEQEDAFRWHPRIYLSGENASSFPRQDWTSRFDFEGPPPAPPVPLEPWEQYAQVLLMSNEFMFVD